jgi:hypothetical protein
MPVMPLWNAAHPVHLEITRVNRGESPDVHLVTLDRAESGDSPHKYSLVTMSPDAPRLSRVTA